MCLKDLYKNHFQAHTIPEAHMEEYNAQVVVLIKMT